jgi:hypothetical protein
MMIEQTLREGNERGVDILSLVDERAALYLAGNLKLVRSRVNCLYLHPPEYSIIDAQGETLPGEWRHQNSAERWWLDCVWNDSRIESFHPPQPSNAEHHQSDSRLETAVHIYTDGHPNILVDAFTV